MFSLRRDFYHISISFMVLATTKSRRLNKFCFIDNFWLNFSKLNNSPNGAEIIEFGQDISHTSDKRNSFPNNLYMPCTITQNLNSKLTIKLAAFYKSLLTTIRWNIRTEFPFSTFSHSLSFQ